MPMSQGLAVGLYKQLDEVRGEASGFQGPRWTDSEILAACKALAVMDGDVPALMIQAWAQTRKASNARAITITHRVDVPATVHAIRPQPPRCVVHPHSGVRGDTGECAGCWRDSQPDPPARAPRSPSRPPVEALRLLEQAKRRQK